MDIGTDVGYQDGKFALMMGDGNVNPCLRLSRWVMVIKMGSSYNGGYLNRLGLSAWQVAQDERWLFE